MPPPFRRDNSFHRPHARDCGMRGAPRGPAEKFLAIALGWGNLSQPITPRWGGVFASPLAVRPFGVAMGRLSPLFAVLFCASAAGLQAAELPRMVAAVEGVTEYRLDNGARVLLFPEASRPTFTVNMTVLV